MSIKNTPLVEGILRRTAHRTQKLEQRRAEEGYWPSEKPSLLRRAVTAWRWVVSPALMKTLAAREHGEYTDGMTGLKNKKGFTKAMSDLARYADPAKTYLLCITDVDHFKRFNDTYGHLNGDQALIHVARTLSHHTRANDVLARYGGEEFAIGAEMPEGMIETFLKKISYAMPKNTIRSLKGTPAENERITISMGAVLVTGEEIKRYGVSTILEQADQNLYAAKKGGRNRCMYQIGMGNKLQKITPIFEI